MPTARPIIIEKFIDHTDRGISPPMRCSEANPTAMPASASISGRPAAMAEPKAMSSRIIVGMAESSSALWSASSLVSLKSLQTGHSPVTATVTPSGTESSSTWSISSPADFGQLCVVRRVEPDGDHRRAPVR